MGALSSLSKSVTLVCWYLAVGATFGFGAIFLFGWLSEEFATSDKWKKRRKLLIVVAIIGVTGEQLATLAEFVLSEHLQTIDDAEISKLKIESLPRAVRFEQSDELFACLKNAPKGTVFVTWAGFNNAAKETDLAVLDLLKRAGFDARPQPLNTNMFVGFSGTGMFLFTHDPSNPPPYATAIVKCFGSEFRHPVGGINPKTSPWLGPSDVMIGVDSDSRS